MQAKQPMKVLGGRNPRPYWDRFKRLQATANLLIGEARSPKGVFRFKTHEQFEQWQTNYRMKKRPARQTKRI
jgi:hypothetical protein